MKVQTVNKRFFESTRGRIVAMLRGSECTVNDLAEKLQLTDNAVRAHLLSLERDGLVRQSGIRRGTRKPHFAYVLTDEADHLFPKAYDALLSQFIAVLKERLNPKAFGDALRAVGRSLARQQTPPGAHASLKSRVQNAAKTLEALGGNPQLDKTDGSLVIRSSSCPLTAVVRDHPETCEMVETLISEMTGANAREQCNRANTPQCEFVITERK